MSQLLIPKTLEARETGDLVQFFNDYDDIIQKNSGIHDSKCLTIDSLDPPCPISEGVFTKVKLTDESVDVVNINKSWINLTVKANVKWSFNKLFDNVNDSQYLAMPTDVFVGLKSSSHIIDSYRILNANRKTGCEQSQALYENAIVHFLKPQQEIEGRPHVYTPWENAYHRSNSVCGNYINDFTADSRSIFDGQEFRKDIVLDLTIPMDDILPLSNISMYPNYLFGNLQMEFRTTSKRNFVWCFVNESDALHAHDIEWLIKIRNNVDDIEYYTRKTFNQCGDAIKVTLPYTDTITSTFGRFHYFEVKVEVSNLVVLSCQSFINGFKIKDSIKNELKRKYSESKLIIPSQFIDYQPMNNGPNGSTLQTSTSYTLTNVSNICVTFPRTNNELTVSRNPKLLAFQLFVDNKPYPEQIGSTTCARYCEYILSNSHLDTLWCGNKSLLSSLTVDEQEQHDHGYLLASDCSNYCFNAATERLCNGRGLYCDGLNKDISVVRLYGSVNGNQLYNDDCPPPHVFYVQTSFWVCTCQGVQYVMNNVDFLKNEED